MSECTIFKPFKFAPEVCDECGKAADAGSHTSGRTDMLPYKEAIWQFILNKGGTYDYYGGYGYDSKEIRDHVATCGLNFDKMEIPEIETVGEFAGTFNGPGTVAVVRGYLICNCKKNPYSKHSWERTDWILREYTLPEIIWHVVKAGEKK